jgi:uncharacterized protein YqeY
MSDLRTKITEAMKTAMKAGEAQRTSAIRMINAGIKQKDIDTRSDTNKELISDVAILSLLQSMIKQRRESITMYEQGGRPELAAKEQAEIQVIEEFLPAQMSEADARKIITDIITSTGAAGIKDMGKVMAAVKEKLSGQYDTAEASKLVKELLVG